MQCTNTTEALSPSSAVPLWGKLVGILLSSGFSWGLAKGMYSQAAELSPYEVAVSLYWSPQLLLVTPLGLDHCSFLLPQFPQS